MALISAAPPRYRGGGRVGRRNPKRGGRSAALPTCPGVRTGRRFAHDSQAEALARLGRGASPNLAPGEFRSDLLIAWRRRSSWSWVDVARPRPNWSAHRGTHRIRKRSRRPPDRWQQRFSWASSKRSDHSWRATVAWPGTLSLGHVAQGMGRRSGRFRWVDGAADSTTNCARRLAHRVPDPASGRRASSTTSLGGPACSELDEGLVELGAHGGAGGGRAGSLRRRMLRDLLARPVVDSTGAAVRSGAPIPAAFSRVARELVERRHSGGAARIDGQSGQADRSIRGGRGSRPRPTVVRTAWPCGNRSCPGRRMRRNGAREAGPGPAGRHPGRDPRATRPFEDAGVQPERRDLS